MICKYLFVILKGSKSETGVLTYSNRLGYKIQLVNLVEYLEEKNTGPFNFNKLQIEVGLIKNKYGFMHIRCL